MDPVSPQDSQNLGVVNPGNTPAASVPVSEAGTTPSPAVPPVGFPPSDSGLPTPSVQTQPEPLTSGDGENKKKVFLVGGIVVFLLLVIGGAILLAPKITSRLAQKMEVTPAATSTPAPIVATARVSYLEGEAWIVSGEEKSPIYEDDEVSEGQAIETGEDAKLTLALEGGSILRLGPSSRVSLSNLDSLDLSFSQEAGDLFAYVEKAVGRFVVTAGEVSVEATGTAFSVEKDQEVQVNVYESSVKVKEGEAEVQVETNSQWVQGTPAPETLDTAEVASNNFLQWALEEEIQRMEAEIISQVAVPENKEDKEAYLAALQEVAGDKKELLKQAFLKTTTGSVGAINLTGEKTPEGAVSLSWTADGLAESGYAIVWSKTPGKPYPGDKRTSKPLYGYEKTLGPMKPGTGTWYFRVCQWTGETCGIYSNELTFTF